MCVWQSSQRVSYFCAFSAMPSKSKRPIPHRQVENDYETCYALELGGLGCGCGPSPQSLLSMRTVCHVIVWHARCNDKFRSFLSRWKENILSGSRLTSFRVKRKRKRIQRYLAWFRVVQGVQRLLSLAGTKTVLTCNYFSPEFPKRHQHTPWNIYIYIHIQ